MPSPVDGACWGLLSYAIGHAFHLLWWRAARPNKDVFALILLLLGTVPFVAMGLGLGAALVHFWIAASYLASYPAFQASSPTLHLLVRLAEASPEGLTIEALSEATKGLDRGNERNASIEALGLSRPDGSLTWAGAALARAFLRYRSWLGLPQGAG